MLLEGILRKYLFLLNLQLKKKPFTILSANIQGGSSANNVCWFDLDILFESLCKLAFTERVQQNVNNMLITGLLKQ